MYHSQKGYWERKQRATCDMHCACPEYSKEWGTHTN